MFTNLAPGQTVRARGFRAVVSCVTPSTVDPEAARVDLRVVTGDRAGETIGLFVPIDDIVAEQVPPLRLEALTSFSLWGRFHDAYRLELAPPPNALVAHPQAQITVDSYQRIPASQALSLPRPRLLLADDVGLGKTIEAGLVYLELAQRRMARRVLVVTPASICRQWQAELYAKFGIEFDVFDRDTIERLRRGAEVGANPWSLRPRVIVSLDLAKMDATFSELRRSRWDLAIIDEAHHVAERDSDQTTQNRRFAEWLATASRSLLLLSATPHDGSDESFASLLRLLEARIAPPGAPLQPRIISDYVVRRLKGDVRADDGSPRFMPRDEVTPLAVVLTPEEKALHAAVMGIVRDIKEQARRASGELRARSEFLTTILRKRMASSREALRRTLQNRRETLATNLETLAVRQDLLRRARASEPLSDDEQAELEHDLHAATLQALQRHARGRARAAQLENDGFLRIQTLLEDLRVPESKVAVLEEYLTRVWDEDPSENVLVFTEYRDTALSLAAEGEGALRPRFGQRVLVLHGESDDREQILQRFVRERGLVLVTTDVASEGLNLQECSRTVVHYDLPWNPNRLEQRNGRVDRYGQRRSPRIAFLYAKDTYDGEILRILIEKVERQVRALGAVGDVLGALQPRRVDRLLEAAAEQMTPELEKTAVSEVDHLISEAKAPTSLQAIHAVTRQISAEEQPDLGSFVVGAIGQCGGRATDRDGIVTVEQFPATWLVDRAQTRFSIPGGPAELPLLNAQSSLVRAAINALRESRYDALRDPRVAARTYREAHRPTLVATFLTSIRAADGGIQERLETLAVTRDGVLEEDPVRFVRAPLTQEPRDLAARAQAEFESWWRDGHARLMLEAKRRAQMWWETLASDRAKELQRNLAAVNAWYAAERQAARSDREDAPLLTGLSSVADEHPAIRREFERIERQRRAQEEELRAHASLEDPVCEALGLLLTMPDDMR